MNRFIRIAVLVMVLPAGQCVLCRAASVVEGVSAQVDDSNIMLSEVMSVVEPQRQKAEKKFSGPELQAELRRVYDEALSSVIEKRLVLNAYKAQAGKEGAREIPEKFIDERIEKIIREMFAGDRAALMAQLEKEKITYDEWRSQIKDQIIIGAMFKANVDDNVKLSPGAVREEYEKNKEKRKLPGKVNISLIAIDRGSSQADIASNRQLADDIVKKTRAGENFAELAKEFSKDSKAEKGGDWGWIDPTILRPELAAEASRLKDGETSDIIEIEDQLYIIRCEGRSNEIALSFEEVQAGIERELRSAQEETLYNAWIERLKKNASIRKFDVCPF
jgi:peptidyl-prolyl cis-trans isomerase SurA